MGMGTTASCSADSAAVLLIALAAFTGPAAAQERVPSRDELHSMYCVEVLRTEITLQHHMIDASSAAAAGAAQPDLRAQWLDTSAELLQRLAKLEGALYRLQLYMLPRIPGVDARALASAIRQADADIHASGEEPAAGSASPGETAVLGRVSACEKPTWVAL